MSPRGHSLLAGDGGARAREFRAAPRAVLALTPLRPRRSPPYLVDPADPALIPLREEIGRRIAGVCAGMDPAAFAQLVDDMALFQHRWEPREKFVARRA